MTPSKPVRREPLARKSRLRPVGTPVRLQRSRAKGARLVSPNGLPVVCVTRPGKWGNPYKVGREQYVPGRGRVLVLTHQHAVELFRLNACDLVAGAIFRRTVQQELRGKNLACWCKPGKPCHAEVLLEIANAPERAGGAS